MNLWSSLLWLPPVHAPSGGNKFEYTVLLSKLINDAHSTERREREREREGREKVRERGEREREKEREREERQREKQFI